MEGGRPGHFVLQRGWHCCMSCLSLTNLTGSTAVQSLPLPTAEIWRGVWRCLAQSQGAESTSTSTWLVASARRNQTLPQAAAKETSCVHILSQHLHPKPCHFYSALHPKGSLVGGKTQELCQQHWGGGAEGRVHHPQPFCWAGRTSWFFGTWFCLLGLLQLLQPPHCDTPAVPSLPRRVPKVLAPEAPPHSLQQ